MSFPGSPSNIGFQFPGQVIANSVIIEGPLDSLLMYNGTATANNLVASDAFANFFDQFGNNVLNGRVIYDSNGFACQLLANGFTIYKNASAPAQSGLWVTIGSFLMNESAPFNFTLNSAQLVVGNIVPTSGDVLEVNGNATLHGFAQTIVGGVVETPHAFNLTGSGFANNGSNTPLKYVTQPDGWIELQGELAVTAAYTAGTGLTFSLPVGYRPNAQADLQVTVSTPGGNVLALLVITNAGSMSFNINLAINNVVCISTRFRTTP